MSENAPPSPEAVWDEHITGCSSCVQHMADLQHAQAHDDKDMALRALNSLCPILKELLADSIRADAAARS